MRLLRVIGWLFAALTSPLWAQIDTGVLSGIVVDNSGAVVPAAAVTIRNTGTNYELQLKTNAAGLYTSPPLPAGNYQIRVQSEGFRPVAKSLTLSLAERLAVDFVLELGAVSEQVTVEALAAPLQTEEATLSTLRTQREVLEVPVNDRNFAELMRYTPGVAPGQAQKNNRALSQARGNTSNAVNGATFGDNNFVIDGIQNNGNHQGWGVMLFPEIEAIDQYRVETSAPDARYGRSGGTLNVGYKSGTNTFHGTLFEFFRNDKLDARNYFAPGRKPPLRRNMFGAVLSGPLGGKDAKTFFLVSYEGRRTRLGKTWVANVPTPLMRQGDFSERPAGSIRDPLSGLPFPGNVIPKSRFAGTPAEKVMNFYPLPNAPGLGANYVTAPSDTQDSDQLTVKIDRSLASGSRGFLRYTQGNFTNLDNRELGIDATPSLLVDNPVYQVVPSYTHIFSPSTINQIRLGATYMPLENRHALDHLADPNISAQFGIPYSNVDKYSAGLSIINVPSLTGIGNKANVPAILHFTNYQVSNNTEMTRGNHSISFGIDVVRRHANDLQTSTPSGTFGFGAIYTGYGASDLLLGKPQSISLVAMDGTLGLRRTDWGLYLQDDWKITPKLTLNAGLRYEIAADYPQSEVANRLVQFDIANGQWLPVGQQGISRTGISNDYNNLAPRLGVAYRLTDSMVVRAAYGIYYSMIPVHIGGSLANQAPIVTNTAVVNDQKNFAGARGLADGPLRVADPNAVGLNRRGILGNYGLGYMQQWNFAIERQLAWQQTITVAYVGSKGTGLNQDVNYNQPVPGDGAVNARRRWPQHSAVDILQSAGSSTFHSLQVSAHRRLASGMSYQLAYTYSHFIDSGSIGSSFADISGIPIGNLSLNKGNSDQDLRHQLRATFLYELPFGRGKSVASNAGSFVNTLVGGWQINGAGSFYTGLPFSVNAKANTLNIGEGTRADRLRDGTLSSSQRTIQQWFDVSAFADPGFRLWGNGGRNVLFGPGTSSFDLSVFKNFLVGENKRLQFRTEFFNITNTPQFNNPNSTLGAPTTGQITSAGSEATLQRTQRQIQLSLKFLF